MNGKAVLNNSAFDKVANAGTIHVDAKEVDALSLTLSAEQIAKVKEKEITLIIETASTTVLIPSTILTEGNVSVNIEKASVWKLTEH